MPGTLEEGELAQFLANLFYDGDQLSMWSFARFS